MARSKKQFSAFSLSFLDIMSCGLGAFILLFLITKHHGQLETLPKGDYLGLEVEKLEKQLVQTLSDIKALNEKNVLYSSKLQDEKTRQILARKKLSEILASMKEEKKAPVSKEILIKNIAKL